MIKQILGFADFPASTRSPTLELLGKGLALTSAVAASSAYCSVANYNGRQWLRRYYDNNPSVYINLSSVGFTPDDIKTRKIFGGFRYCISNNQEFGTNPILHLSRESSYSVLLESMLTSLQGEAYIEYCIDVPALTVKVWVDGVLKNTAALSSGEANSTKDFRVTMGQYGGSLTAEFHYYNDFYWLLDTSDVDNTPSKRLGPVKVGGVRVDAADVPADWTLPEDRTAEQVLSTDGLGPTGETSPVIRTSPAETVATFGFEQPAVEFPILAVAVEAYGYRDTGTVPTLVTQVKQGETLAEKQTHFLETSVLREGANANRIGCFNLDLNNKPWTVESIGELEILVNSKTGS